MDKNTATSKARCAGKPYGYVWSAILADLDNFIKSYREGVSTEELAKRYDTTEGAMISNILRKLRMQGKLSEEDTTTRKASVLALSRETRKTSHEAWLVERADELKKKGAGYIGLASILYNQKELASEFGCKDVYELAELKDYLMKDGSLKAHYTYEYIVKNVLRIHSLESWYLYFTEFPLPDDNAYGVIHALSTLTDKERNVLLLLAKGVTLEDVGKEFRVGKNRVAQIRDKAYRKLRHSSRCRYMTLGYKEMSRIEEERVNRAKAEVKELTIEDLNLSVRAYNVLVRAGAKSIEDVVALINTGYILYARCLGKVSYADILECLRKAGVEVNPPTEYRPTGSGIGICTYNRDLVKAAHLALSFKGE